MTFSTDEQKLPPKNSCRRYSV